MNGQSLSILLVEDDRDTAYVLTRILQRRGFVMLTARCLADARDLCKRNGFDVLLADIGLPDGSGLELPRLVRQHHPHVCCVALSGHGRNEDVEQGLDAGFDHYLVKPVMMEDLERVLDHCDTSTGAASPGPNGAGEQLAM
jgi:DNA-binding response OmpR family regulator